jgi:hypothetical protein
MTYLARHQWIRQIRDCADAFDAGAKVPRVGFSPYFRAELVTALRDLAALIEGSADQEVLNVQIRRALGLVLVCMFPDPTEDLPADAERELCQPRRRGGPHSHAAPVHPWQRGLAMISEPDRECITAQRKARMSPELFARDDRVPPKSASVLVVIFLRLQTTVLRRVSHLTKCNDRKVGHPLLLVGGERHGCRRFRPLPVLPSGGRAQSLPAGRRQDPRSIPGQY